MSNADKIAQRIKAAIPTMEMGTLRFWAVWFGRPYDNWHQMTDADADSGFLRLRFVQGESLCVWDPHGLELSKRTFRIQEASRVRWEWHYYGRPKTDENLRFIELAKSDDQIVVTTNAEWNPEPTPIARFPAVEIL